MDKHPYHSYLFFNLNPAFYQLPIEQRVSQKNAFRDEIKNNANLKVLSYATLGLKPNTTFMLWCWAKDPVDTQNLVRSLLATPLGQWLSISHSYFGIERDSTYSGRKGRPEQTIQNFTDRLPYLLLYPFTKTTDWYLLDMENRRSIMGQHIKKGMEFPDIRQCLLYSYGIDDNEFLVSYESKTLEEFQDLIIQMRSTIGRKYTLNDTPIYTCIHKPIDELVAWL